MSLYKLRTVRVAGDVAELSSLLFTGEEDEFRMPEPGTALLFTLEDAARKDTTNLCQKGEETISLVLNEILENGKAYLVVVKMSVIKTEGLMFHPLFRLKQLPTIMSLDGELRLSGWDLSNQLLVWDFFQAVLSSSSDRQAKAFLTMTSPEYVPERLFSSENAGDYGKPPVLPLELVYFWEVGEAARARAEVTAQLEGLKDLKTEADRKLLEDKIREELAVLVQEHEAAELLAHLKETDEEPIVPLDLDDLVLVKDTLQILRKQRPLSPTISKKLGKRSKKKPKKKPKKGAGKSKKTSKKSKKKPAKK